jgi:hypothetical protein
MGKKKVRERGMDGVNLFRCESRLSRCTAVREHVLHGYVLCQRQCAFVWWPYATLFAFIFLLYNRYIHSSFDIHSQTFEHTLMPISMSPWLRGRNLHGVPSRDSNSGLPYSKPAYYHLSHAAPPTLHPKPRCTLSHAAP